MKAVAEDDLAGLLAVLPPTEAIDVAAGLAPLDRELGRSAVRPDLLVRTEDVIVHASTSRTAGQTCRSGWSSTGRRSAGGTPSNASCSSCWCSTARSSCPT